MDHNGHGPSGYGTECHSTSQRNGGVCLCTSYEKFYGKLRISEWQ
jgi:hypothetical protein